MEAVAAGDEVADQLALGPGLPVADPRALGHEVPLFAHLPLILNTDRTKMSKRKSQTAVDDYIEQGFQFFQADTDLGFMAAGARRLLDPLGKKGAPGGESAI